VIIVHVTNDDGGVGSVIANLAMEQTAHGHIVFVVSNAKRQFFNKLPEKVETIMVNTGRLPIMLKGFPLAKLYKSMRNLYPHDKVVIHAHNVSTIGLFSRIKKLPLVVTIHGQSVFHVSGEEKISCREHLRNRVIKLILKKLSRNNLPIVCVSDYVKRYYSDVVNKGMITIHNGVNASSEKRREPDYFTIAHVGDLSLKKGWNVEFEAFKILLQRYENKKVRFISAGRAMDFNKKSIDDLKLRYNLDDDNLVYYGVVNNVYRDVLAETDVLLLISASEGLPMSIVEAQSMGIPVIATNVGGIPEIVLDGVNGYLVPPNPEIIAAKIESLFDENQKNQMQKEARKVFQEGFTACAMDKAYEEVYLLKCAN